MDLDLTPRAGFDWSAVTWGATEQPPLPDCSYCTAPLGAGELSADICTRTGWRARFCEHCQWTWWGIERPA